MLREGKRGFRVAPVSRADLVDLATTLCWVVDVALRQSLAKGDEAWEEAVVLAAHRLQRLDSRLPSHETGAGPRMGASARRFSHEPHCRERSAAHQRLLRDSDRPLRPLHVSRGGCDGALAARCGGRAQGNPRRGDGADADFAVRLSQAHIRRTAEIVEASWIARRSDDEIAPSVSLRQRKLLTSPGSVGLYQRPKALLLRLSRKDPSLRSG